MSASAHAAATDVGDDETPEVLEPVLAVPTVMLGAFTAASVVAVLVAGYASWLGDHNVALTISISGLVGLSAYLLAVIGLQRRRIEHLVMSMDGLIQVAAAPTRAEVHGSPADPVTHAPERTPVAPVRTVRAAA